MCLGVWAPSLTFYFGLPNEGESPLGAVLAAWWSFSLYNSLRHNMEHIDDETHAKHIHGTYRAIIAHEMATCKWAKTLKFNLNLGVLSRS